MTFDVSQERRVQVVVDGGWRCWMDSHVACCRALRDPVAARVDGPRRQAQIAVGEQCGIQRLTETATEGDASPGVTDEERLVTAEATTPPLLLEGCRVAV